MYNSYPEQLEWPPPPPLLLADPPLPSPPFSQHGSSSSLSFPHISHFPPLSSPTTPATSSALRQPRSPPPSSSSTAYADEKLSHYSPHPLPSLDTFTSLLPASSTLQPPPAAVPIDTLISAASCLSFDPQHALEQLVSQAQPTSPVSAEPRRRQRIPGLTKQQRTERKKQKHREIDAVRRHREHTVVVKMQQLMESGNNSNNNNNKPQANNSNSNSRQHKRLKSATTDSLEAAQPDSDDTSDEREPNDDEAAGDDSNGGTVRRSGQRGEKMDKVSVMERAADHMERMQAVLQQMAAACTKQQQHLRYFLEHQHRLTAATSTTSSSSSSSSAPPPHPLSTLHPYASQRLYAHIGSATLHSTQSMSGSASIMVVSLSTGCFLHANDRFLAMTGWQPAHLVGRLMMPPPHSFVHGRVVAALPNSYLVDGGEGRSMREACFYDQAERSKQMMGLLLAGQLRTVTAVWRFLMKDSRLYDVESTTWLGYQDSADGQPGKLPAYAVFVSYLDRRVRVSPEAVLGKSEYPL